jgi:hypothetical protein
MVKRKMTKRHTVVLTFMNKIYKCPYIYQGEHPNAQPPKTPGHMRLTHFLPIQQLTTQYESILTQCTIEVEL